MTTLESNQSDRSLQSFDEYERDWKRRHKGSIPRQPRVSSAREIFWIVFWLVVAVGAAIFSAAHTIPAAELTIFASVPQRGLLAITAFVIVELVIFGAAAGRREIGWLKWLLLGALLVALAGNNSSSIKAVTENGGDLLNQFGGVLLSTIAPFTALAAGEVLHIQLDKRNQKLEVARAAYEAAYREMEAKINAAYSKYLKEREPKQSVQAVNSVKFNSFNRDKPSKKLQAAVNWLNEHPEHLDTESRELTQYIDASYVTIWKAQQLIKANQNGHSNVQ